MTNKIEADADFLATKNLLLRIANECEQEKPEVQLAAMMLMRSRMLEKEEAKTLFHNQPNIMSVVINAEAILREFWIKGQK